MNNQNITIKYLAEVPEVIPVIAEQIGVKVLYLYTPSAGDFYKQIGWFHYEDLKYKSKDVVIMNKFLYK